MKTTETHNAYTEHKEIIDRLWDWKKNKIHPSQYAPTSKTIVYWKCNFCGYQWKDSIYHVAVQRLFCSHCVEGLLKQRYVKKILLENIFNKIKDKSLKEASPDLYEKLNKNQENMDIISKLFCNSRKKVFWKTKRTEKYCSIKDMVKQYLYDTYLKDNKNYFDILKTSEIPISTLNSNLEKIYSKDNKVSFKTIKINDKHTYLWICKNCGKLYLATPFNVYTEKRQYCRDCEKVFEEERKQNKPEKYSQELKISFESKYPKIVEKFWDYDLNTIPPSHYPPHSNARVYCRCPICNHVWYPTIHDLAKGSGCPECWRNATSSKPEKYIFDLLHIYDDKWMNGVYLSNFIEGCRWKYTIDCLNPDLKIAVEYDGWRFHNDPSFEQYAQNKMHDEHKNELLKSENWTLIRITEIKGNKRVYWNESKDKIIIPVQPSEKNLELVGKMLIEKIYSVI